MDRASQPPPRAAYAAAAEALAERVVCALKGAHDGFRLAEQLPADEVTGLAAVRVLGPDALAPYTVGRSSITAEDTEVVTAAFTAFPHTEPAEGPCSGPSVPALRDWATAGLLYRLGADHNMLEELNDSVWDEWPGAHQDWLRFSGFLAALAPLATPGLNSPAHQQARRRPLDISRGVTRAVLRGDHLTAARLARWLFSVGPGPLEPKPLLRHLELIGGADSRLQLEIALAQAALTGADNEPVRSRG